MTIIGKIDMIIHKMKVKVEHVNIILSSWKACWFAMIV